jgi:hypothetical protein
VARGTICSRFLLEQGSKLSQFIWFIGTLLQAVLLLRFLWSNEVRHYVFFFFYLVGSLIGSAVLYVIFFTNSKSYAEWYWAIQILTLILGCGIILEIFKHTLAHYPGAERFAMAVAILILGATLSFAALRTLLSPTSSVPSLNFELERDLRLVQALLLFSLMAIIFWYGIAMGSNMKGMIVGYGLYIGASLVSLAIRFYIRRPLPAQVIFRQTAYDLALIVWLVALWSYRPDPAPASSIDLESDYEALVAGTKAKMSSVRSHLGKAVGS